MGYLDPVVVPKLTRDNMPGIWAAHGDIVEFSYITGAVKRQAMREKLVEEANEVRVATSRREMRGELADVLQVAQALAKEFDIPWMEVEQVMCEAEANRGSFNLGVYLTKFEWGPGRAK